MMILALVGGIAFGQPVPVDVTARDAQPLPRYLQPAQIQQVLADTDWSACLVGEGTGTATMQMEFQIGATGEVLEPSLEGVPEPQESCWRETLRGVRFPAHDELSFTVRWTLAVRDGQPLPYPVVDVEERDLHPLFIFTDPSAAAVQHDALRAALGLAEE